MGGYGSTRWFLHNKKALVSDYQTLHIQEFDKALLADAYINGYRVYYADSSTVKLVDELLRECGLDNLKPPPRINGLQVDRIPMCYGGYRYYLLCPQCGRRCEIVYYPDRWFNRVACRRCHDLTYRSSQEAHEYDRGQLGHYIRLIDRLDRLEKVHTKMERCHFGSKHWKRLAKRAWELM